MYLCRGKTNEDYSVIDTDNQIFIDDYDYPLPEERIAKYPLAQRDASKLLVYREGVLTDTVFSNVGSYLSAGDLLVVNNTRVIHARLHFATASGALVEIFLLEPIAPAEYEQMFVCRGTCRWQCLVGNSRRWKDDTLTATFPFAAGALTLHAQRGAACGRAYEITLSWQPAEQTFAEVLALAGELPLPPYLKRAAEQSDELSYQTVYAHRDGSVAAPTAGLHFTPAVLDALAQRGIECQALTLHVGAGTFLPVKSDEIHNHAMHTERIEVPLALLEALIAHKGAAVAVGTTSVRVLESLYYLGLHVLRAGSSGTPVLHVEQWEPYAPAPAVETLPALEALVAFLRARSLSTLYATTQLMIIPGFRYRLVRAMITNFHQRRSTLLLLVAAFIGDAWRDVYSHALAHDYRFLSYGDACLFIK